MNKKDVFKKRKKRKDTIKQRKRRVRYKVRIRFIATREFEVLANSDREAVLESMTKLRLIEPPDAVSVSTVVTSRYGTKVYDHHFQEQE